MATYEYKWQREAAVWKAVAQAIEAARNGDTPATPCIQPPAWLASVVRARLEAVATHWPNQASIGVIRALEQLGLMTLEADDTYVLAVVGNLGDRFEHS